MRARNIKPGFFKNEDLADAGPYARLLFAGLWCLADKAGRLKDRPRQIKAEVFPYDEKMPGIDGLLNSLQVRDFITRYQVNGTKYIQINHFAEHQHPHNTERESNIPAPLDNGCLTVNSPLPNGGNPDDSLIHDSLKHERCNVATGEPPVAVPPVFTCPFFSIDQTYYKQLLNDYPGLDSSRLMLEVKKAADYIADNPKKYQRRANGNIANPRLFIRNWLSRVTVNPSGGLDTWTPTISES